ncbi:23S rRNA (uracil(1939)-C(5))-methyltransferase RlmD [Thiomicrorhabdus sp.]|uniref:23S rRNA (uracil(1939)-C(5))-methyltransferase RlmD n=1 Tax=Thiomicrorhabdus sp. TaxID=2039724 RepID=UPI0029C8BD15|nr:23S rRNA (uracil(1939)-C(5))-methyltransferase RlmD [Thiomicrorhabdus sp.]
MTSDPFELNIENLSHDGRGVGRHQGKTCFVEGAVPGDRVSVAVTQDNDHFADCKLLETLDASPDRQTPFCEYYGLCGGCQLQHLNVEAQRKWKFANILTSLKQALKQDDFEVCPPLTGTDIGYRRRARFFLSIDKKEKQPRLGFKENSSNRLVDIEQCPVLDPELNQALQTHRNPLLNSASRAEKQLTIVKADNGVFGFEEREETPYYSIEPQLKMHFDQEGFIQVNGEINRKMITQALDWLELQTQHKVLDLFCGQGNFTLPIAKQAKEVIGIEGDDNAVAMGNFNAESNGIANCRFEKFDLFQDPSSYAWFRKQRYDRILLDPGRLGAAELCKHLGKLDAQLIVYVSCNASTLIRDLQTLQSQGYQLQKIGFMDMFPHTTHTEVMVQLRKNAKAGKSREKRTQAKKQFRF